MPLIVGVLRPELVDEREEHHQGAVTLVQQAELGDVRRSDTYAGVGVRHVCAKGDKRFERECSSGVQEELRDVGGSGVANRSPERRQKLLLVRMVEASRMTEGVVRDQPHQGSVGLVRQEAVRDMQVEALLMADGLSELKRKRESAAVGFHTEEVVGQNRLGGDVLRKESDTDPAIGAEESAERDGATVDGKVMKLDVQGRGGVDREGGAERERADHWLSRGGGMRGSVDWTRRGQRGAQRE